MCPSSGQTIDRMFRYNSQELRRGEALLKSDQPVAVTFFVPVSAGNATPPKAMEEHTEWVLPRFMGRKYRDSPTRVH